MPPLNQERKGLFMLATFYIILFLLSYKWPGLSRMVLTLMNYVRPSITEGLGQVSKLKFSLNTKTSSCRC